MSAHVVILGCGRSGTSIFGELFEGLVSYRDRYLFEPTFETLREMDFSVGPVAIKVPRVGTTQLMTPGLPFLLSELLAVVPRPRVLFWQIRHPLDAICSLRPGIAANWSHNPKPPDWQDWLSKPLIMQCARHWQYINEPGYSAVKEIATVTRYENLVSEPWLFARQVCDLAGIDSFNEMPGIESWVARIGNAKAPGSYEAKHQVHWSRADHVKRVTRWKENLTAQDVGMVLPIIANAAKLHGYELPKRSAE